MMAMVGGDVVQYNALKRASIGEYLLKLDIFASEFEQNEKLREKTNGVRK